MKIFYFIMLIILLISGDAYATEYKLIYPQTVDTYAKKIAFAYRVHELLVQQYNKAGARLLNKEIKEEQFKDWKENTWRPRMRAVSRKIVQGKTLLKKATDFTPNLENIFEKIPE